MTNIRTGKLLRIALGLPAALLLLMWTPGSVASSTDAPKEVHRVENSARLCKRFSVFPTTFLETFSTRRGV